MKRAIAITNRHPRLRFRRADVARAIATLEANPAAIRLPPSAIPQGELSIVFLTDAALATIHGDFMDDPTATDVITFEGDPAAGLAGEICVSADTAARFVGLLEGPAPAGPRPSGSWALQKKRLAGTRALQEAFSAELTLYIVHGWLHLAGHDDLQPAKKRRMRAAEKRAMKMLQDARAIPAFKLD